LCGEGRGLADVLCDLRAGRHPEPDPARLAAPPRAFRGAGTGEGLGTCSPDGAKRNPGKYDRGEEIPDCASLHPGYEVRPTTIIQRPTRIGNHPNAWSPRSIWS